MKAFEKILQDNKEWAARMLAGDPDYFNRLVNIQSPEVLWIGCSDSRVPADKITGTEPGEIFVHRNIANLVVNTDINFLSVLQYAVEILKVKHIIVCGHYGCGGVEAAMAQKKYGIIDNWLKEIKDVYRNNRHKLESLTNEQERLNCMVELNVREQVFNLAKTSIIQIAWKEQQRPQLHGWVYSLTNGIIKPVCDMDENSPIDPLYRFSNL
jgi:carbonic anhydrase